MQRSSPRRSGLSLLLAAGLLASGARGDPGGEAPPRDAPASAEAPATSEAPAEIQPPPATESLPALQEKRTLLVLDLEPIDVDAGVVRVINQLVTETYSRRPELKVVASTDIRQLIELEAARSTVGCDDTACLTEIAGAMGARYVVFGTVGRLGDLLVVNLNVFDSDRAEAVQRHTIRTRAVERLPEELEAVVLGIERAPEETPSPSGAATPPSSPPPGDPEDATALVWVGGGASALGALCLATAGVGALLVDSTLGDPSSKPADKSLALGAAPYLVGAALGGSVLLVGGGVAVGIGSME